MQIKLKIIFAISVSLVGFSFSALKEAKAIEINVPKLKEPLLVTEKTMRDFFSPSETLEVFSIQDTPQGRPPMGKIELEKEDLDKLKDLKFVTDGITFLEFFHIFLVTNGISAVMCTYHSSSTPWIEMNAIGSSEGGLVSEGRPLRILGEDGTVYRGFRSTFFTSIIKKKLGYKRSDYR